MGGSPILMTAQMPFDNMTYSIMLLIPIVICGGFLIYSKIQKKKAKQRQEEIYTKLHYGDKITFTNGMVGTYLSSAAGTVEVELSQGAKARFMTWAIKDINKK